MPRKLKAMLGGLRGGTLEAVRGAVRGGRRSARFSAQTSGDWSGVPRGKQGVGRDNRLDDGPENRPDDGPENRPGNRPESRPDNGPGRKVRPKRRAKWRPKLHAEAGLTLLELVVAVMVLSLGTIAALRATDQSRLAIGGAEPRALAQIVVRNRAQELRLHGGRARLPGEVELGGRLFTVTVRTARTSGGLIRATITARSTTGPGASLVTFVPASGAPQ